MSYQGDIRLGDTIDFTFTTVGSAGAPTTLSGTPVVSAYPGNSTTEITAGITLTADFDSRTGLNHVRVVASSGNGYATATDYSLVITTGTVGGSSVVGYEVGSFSIENRVVNAAKIADGAITASKFAANAIAAAALAADALAAIKTQVDAGFTTQMADSVAAVGSIPTREQALRMAVQFLSEFGIIGTELTVKKEDGTTTLMTFTLDDGTDPTSISRTT